MKTVKPLKTRLLAATIPVLFLAVLAISVTNLLAFKQLHSIYRGLMEDRLFTISMSIRSVINKNLEMFPLEKLLGMSTYLNGVVESNHDLSYTFVADTSNQILYHSNDVKAGTAIDRSRYKIIEKDEETEKTVLSVGSFYEVTIPIIKSDETIGTIHIGVSKDLIDSKLTNLIVATVFILLLSLGVFVWVFYSMLDRSIIKPISTMAEKASAISTSRDLTQRIDFESGDEIGVLATSFNSMIQNLEDYNDELEGKVAERTVAIKSAKEEAERANMAKSQFLSSMSHELRTPLNSILGFAQLLESDTAEPLMEGQLDNIRQVIKSGNHLLALINEVLDLAKIESGNISISLEAVNTVEVVEEALVLIGAVARHRKLSLNKDIAEGDWFVKADLTRLKQVVLNLLSNAVKYNREGGTVTVAVYPGQDGGTTCIAVEDTGMGISEENISKLFEPFNRLGAEALNVEGTGIGLTITKRLVELMGGDIRVESGVGKGSRFIVTLPAAIEPAQDIHELESIKPLAVESPAGQMTLLYVEDNPANLKLVERIIERRPNLKMISAPYAQLGIDLARAHNPFVVLMDINLPGMNGFEALKELRQNDDTADIPVIAVSANAMPKDIQRAKDAGFADYITKPINVTDFLKLIDKIVIEV